MAFENFTLNIDADGIAVFTWDMPERSMNVLSQSSIGELAQIVEQIKTDKAIKGVVFTSGKAAFCAGADLSMLGGTVDTKGKTELEQIEEAFGFAMRLSNILRDIETCGKPVVAAINGLALGGGLEVTLACHYRVVVDDPKIQLGLPEATIGALQGAGGTQRLPRLIGAAAALPMLLQGKPCNPAKALALGFVHAVVPSDQLISAAKKWINEGGEAIAPWDKKDFRVPGGTPHGIGGKSASDVFTMGNAMLHAQTKNNYPAQRYIMSCVYEGLNCHSIDPALRIEARYFTKLLRRPESKNMIRSLFLSMQALSKGARRPKNIAPYKIKKLGVLGAGMMGAGIAYVSARAGMQVVLLDTSQEMAEKGKAYSEALLDKAIKRGKSTPDKKQALLGLITPTTSYDDLKGADLIIEAVFEDKTLKADVTKMAEAQLEVGAVFGSNTSTIPISELAAASARPSEFIGIHFFSPVDKMNLVEIIMGKDTSDETLAKTMDYVAAIRKTPIVVNDSRGFYTSRVFGTYVREGQLMVSEGIDPVIIENVGKRTGMPMPPLALSDEVALDLSHKVREQTKKDLGDDYVGGADDDLIKTLVIDKKRVGKKVGKGFYDWPDDKKGKKKLWHGLADIVPVTQGIDDVSLDDMQKRLMFTQCIETVRCLEENVVTDPRDADVGSILGWGFAPFSGGTLSYIEMIGLETFVKEADLLAQKYGERFTPPQLLRDMAASGQGFYDALNAQQAAQ